MRAHIIFMLVLGYFCGDTSILAGNKGMTQGQAEEAKDDIMTFMRPFRQKGYLPLQVLAMDKDALKPFSHNHASQMVNFWKSVEDSCTDVMMPLMPVGTKHPATFALEKLNGMLKRRAAPTTFKQPGDRMIKLKAVDPKKSPLQEVEYDLGEGNPVAEGSFGEIYFGHDSEMKQSAIKTAKPDKESIEELETEANIYYAFYKRRQQKPPVAMIGIPEYYCFGNIVEDEIFGKQSNQPTNCATKQNEEDRQPIASPEQLQPTPPAQPSETQSAEPPKKPLSEVSTNASPSSSHEEKGSSEVVSSSGSGPPGNPAHIGSPANGEPAAPPRALAIERLNYSLLELFYMCSRHFSLKTTIMIAEQMVDLIMILQAMELSNNDIKPQNILIGPYLGEDPESIKKFNTLHMIDFGHTAAFKDWKPNSDVKGTPTFLGLNQHHRRPSSRWDDFQSLWFILNLFLRGSLPWFFENDTGYKKPDPRTGFPNQGNSGSDGPNLDENIKSVEGVPELVEPMTDVQSVDKSLCNTQEQGTASTAPNVPQNKEDSAGDKENLDSDEENADTASGSCVYNQTEGTDDEKDKKEEIGESSNSTNSDQKVGIDSHTTTSPNPANSNSEKSEDDFEFARRRKLKHFETLAADLPGYLALKLIINEFEQCDMPNEMAFFIIRESFQMHPPATCTMYVRVELTILRDYVFAPLGSSPAELAAWEKLLPDYNYLKTILNLLFMRMGYNRDGIFDWINKLKVLNNKNLFGLGFGLKDFAVDAFSDETKTVLYLIASPFYYDIYSVIMKRREGHWKLKVTDEMNMRAQNEADANAGKQFYYQRDVGRLAVGVTILAQDLNKLQSIFKTVARDFLNQCKDSHLWTIGFGYHFNENDNSFFMLTIVEEDFPIAVINSLRLNQTKPNLNQLGRANELMKTAEDYAKLKAGSYGNTELPIIEHCTLISFQMKQTSNTESYITDTNAFKIELTKAIHSLDNVCKDKKEILLKNANLGGLAYAVLPRVNNRKILEFVLLAPMFYRLPLQLLKLWRQGLTPLRISCDLMFEAQQFADRNFERGPCLIIEQGRITVASIVNADNFAQFFDTFHGEGFLRTKLIRNPILELAGFGFKYDEGKKLYYCVMILSNDVVAAFARFRGKFLRSSPELMNLAKECTELRAEGKQFAHKLNGQQLYIVSLTIKQWPLTAPELDKKIDLAELFRTLPGTEMERLMDPSRLDKIGYGFQRQYRNSDDLHFVFLAKYVFQYSPMLQRFNAWRNVLQLGLKPLKPDNDLMSEAMEFAGRENRKNEFIHETGRTTLGRFYSLAEFGKIFESKHEQMQVRNEFFLWAGFGFGYCVTKEQYYFVVILAEDVRDTVMRLFGGINFKLEAEDVKQLARKCAERIAMDQDYNELQQDTHCEIFSLELQSSVKKSYSRKSELLESMEKLVKKPGNQVGQLKERYKFSGIQHAYKRREAGQTLFLVVVFTKILRKAMLYANEERRSTGLYDLILRRDHSSMPLPGNYKIVGNYKIQDYQNLEDVMLAAMKKAKEHLHNVDIRFIRICSKETMEEGNKLMLEIDLYFDEYSTLYLESIRNYFEKSGISHDNIKIPNFEEMKHLNQFASEVAALDDDGGKLDAILNKLETAQIHIIEESYIQTDLSTNLSSTIGNIFPNVNLLAELKHKFGPDVFMIALGCAITKNGKPKIVVRIKTYYELSMQFLNSKRLENIPVLPKLQLHPENTELSKLLHPKGIGETMTILPSRIEKNEKLKLLMGYVFMSMPYDNISAITLEERCLAMAKQALLKNNSSKFLDPNISHVGFAEHRNREAKKLKFYVYFSTIIYK